MKRLAVTAVLLLLCISFPSSLAARGKETSVDMRNMNHIFLGWIDLDPEKFLDLGYSKGEWTEVIGAANSLFQRNCQSRYLPDRTITAAKDKGDENAAGNDLSIKFSDVSFDTSYRLHLSIHFIDPKTNSEIASVPGQTYAAHLCGLVSCLEKELDEVGKKLQEAVASESKEKKK
ncbi:MAG: hypothetical protein ABSG70_12385 [Terriglobales bacterium]|jgi:hypothetical protein